MRAGICANGNIVSAGGVEYERFKTDGGVEVRVTALKTKLPMAVLPSPVVPSASATWPIAVLSLPLLVTMALKPTAVLLLPMTLNWSALKPTAVLLSPVVLLMSALKPLAVSYGEIHPAVNGAADFHIRADAIDAMKKVIAEVTTPSLNEEGCQSINVPGRRGSHAFPAVHGMAR